uniref:Uncharacterized protein n=1 Tax=Panagrolaimus sp. PS1159 TaxID=55785 RepID=A0AC35ESF3_9BILA
MFSIRMCVFLLLASIIFIQYSESAPQYYNSGYGLSDPAFNGGTRSTWQDSIVLHLFGPMPGRVRPVLPQR